MMPTGYVEVTVAEGREPQRAPSARQGMLRAQPDLCASFTPSPGLPALRGSFCAEASKLTLNSGGLTPGPRGLSD